MKRQSSAVSPSSSRRENTPENFHGKTIGCMSGILHLISSSHSRRTRRFLTFGKRQNKNHASPAASPASADKANSPPEKAKEEKTAKIAAADCNARLSSEVPRSPTLPAEIRLSSPAKSPESPLEAPALVARLMGLEAVPASPDSVAEKRRKLLGALQRCDEDLKALKKIIEAVRSSDPPSPAAVSQSDGDGVVKTVTEVKCSAVNGEQQQPSPVSVLDEFTRSPPLSPNCYSGRHSSETKAKAENIFVKAKEEIKAIAHHDKSKRHHHKETHGRSDDIDESTPTSEVKGPNAFERVKEEFEAVFESIHHKKES